MPRALRLILLGTLVVALMAVSCAAQKEVKRIDKDTLKGWLGRPDVVIIDVRSPQDWAASDKKIPGAVRREPGDVATWGQTLPKDKRIVAYCA